MLSVMSVPFSLKTVGNLCLVSEMMKTCFIVDLFCGVNILLQNQIICLKVGFYCVIIR